MLSIDGSNYIAIKLVNTPTKCPMINGQGLNQNQRPYGLEYIPFMFPFGNYADLTTRNPDVPKNTARWIITIHDVEKTDDIAKPLKVYYTIDPPTSTRGRSHIFDLGMWDKMPEYTGKTYVWVCKK